MATFDMNDDSVVVVVGSGAGGGTLGAELAIKGVKTVILEAGGRHETSDFQNDEWGSFGQISWLDKRTTSGSWRVAKDFAGLPAWIVKAVGGSTTHWAGASLRFQEHEWKATGDESQISAARVDHLPIIGSYARRLKLVEIVNQLVPTQMAVEPGVIVLGMVLDTLSGRSPLYHLEKSFEGCDRRVLFGEDLPPGSLLSGLEPNGINMLE